ncbi:unannotated protein [freshwater metagenome]|uniref:Unannotated protein n=1 Tax=freshwater metagenome TaxID=449393 RepID=A0A6J7R0R4_9ZZZZ
MGYRTTGLPNFEVLPHADNGNDAISQGRLGFSVNNFIGFTMVLTALTVPYDGK